MPDHRLMRIYLLLGLALAVPEVHAAHAYAQFGDIKYPPGFAHFEWVNPNAPKGGELELVPPLRITNFDKYNPFTLKGTAPPGLGSLVFESLLTGTLDEPTTAYGLLAEDVEVAPDGLSATFRLNPAARFHDGTPVMAADVKHSFDTLMSKQAAPQYRVVLRRRRSRRWSPARARCASNSSSANAELPLMVGGLPVFSRAWGAGKPFDQVVMDMPIASGPYKIGPLNFGRDITYERDPNYWARDLERAPRHVQLRPHHLQDLQGQHRADRGLQGRRVRLHAQVFSARDWARTYVGKKFDSGELIKDELPAQERRRLPGLPHQHAAREVQGPARARGARARLRLRVDEPAAVLQLVHARARLLQRQRLRGEGPARAGRAGAARAAARRSCPTKVFTRGSAAAALDRPARQPARQPAQGARAARRGRLDLPRRRAAQRQGRAFTLEYLDSGGGERIDRALLRRRSAKLGIAGRVPAGGLRADPASGSTCSTSIIFTVRIPGSEAPGQRAARPLRLEIGRHRRLEQPDGRARSGGRRAASNLAVSAHDAARARRAPARARPRAAARPLRRAAVLLRAPSASRTAPASSSSPRSRRSTTRPRTGSISTWWRKQ